MRCQRKNCGGVLVPDIGVDYGDCRVGLCELWRCMSCGDVIDPTILLRRSGLGVKYRIYSGYIRLRKKGGYGG